MSASRLESEKTLLHRITNSGFVLKCTEFIGELVLAQGVKDRKAKTLTM